MLLRDHLNTLIEIQSECVSTLTSLCSCFTSKCMILKELLKKRDSRGLIIKNYLNLNFNKKNNSPWKLCEERETRQAATATEEQLF